MLLVTGGNGLCRSKRERLLFTMFPNAAVTLNAVCVRKRAGAGMGAQALPSMANPGLTEVTYGPL